MPPSVRGHLVVVGSVNADLMIPIDRMPDAGETVEGLRLDHYPGGKVRSTKEGSPRTENLLSTPPSPPQNRDSSHVTPMVHVGRQSGSGGCAARLSHNLHRTVGYRWCRRFPH
jgi:hypothetical protein